MGLLEGQATAQSIDDAFANFNASNAYLQNAHLPPVLETYLQTQRAWMDEQVGTTPCTGRARRRRRYAFPRTLTPPLDPRFM